MRQKFFNLFPEPYSFDLLSNQKDSNKYLPSTSQGVPTTLQSTPSEILFKATFGFSKKFMAISEPPFNNTSDPFEDNDFFPPLSDKTLTRSQISKKFQESQLRDLAEKYKQEIIELEEICSEIRDAEGHPIKTSKSTVKNYWTQLGIDWQRTSGRKKKEIDPEVEATILQIWNQPYKPGVRKMHSILLLPEYDFLGPVSLRDVLKVFKKNSLWRGKLKKQKKELYRCEYEADYVNMIWHTDLHLFKKTQQVITWIDDKSRKCMGFKFIRNKEAKATRKALEEVLERYSKPYAIWSDNGTEFKAEFAELLAENGILHVHTLPGNPQQNGKCERYWKTLEMAAGPDEVATLIDQYNNIPHFSLPRIQRTHGVGEMTPEEVWNDSNLHMGPETKPTWTIDGVSGIPFKVRVKH
jgi:hypothetical protein